MFPKSNQMTSSLLGIFVYLIFQFLIGAWLLRRIKNETDYYVAGRKVGLSMETFSVFATWFGAETCMGASGLVYEKGLAGGRSDPFGYTLCLVVLGFFFARKLWENKLTTLGDLFEKRFGKNVMRLAILVLLPTSLLWAAAQVRAFGQVLSTASGFSLTESMTIAAVIVVGYTMLGGLLADIYTDFLQGIALIVGLVAIFVLVIWEHGNVSQLLSNLPVEKFYIKTPDETWWQVGDAWAVPLLGSLVSQEIVARIISSQSAKVARKACLIASGLYLSVGLIPIFIGLVGPAILPDLADHEQILPLIAEKYLPHFGFILFSGAIVSAILSTVDSALLAVSALISHNLIVPAMKNPSPEKKLLLARSGTAIAGVVAFIFALQSDGIFELIETSSSFGSAGILVLMTAVLFTKFDSILGAVSCLILGIIFLPIAEHILGLQAPYLATILVSTFGLIFGGGLEKRMKTKKHK